MSPNHLKLLIIAPLSALFLTACPNNSDRLASQSETASRFSGWWINENLNELYRTSNGSRANFCKGLATNYELYGVTSDNRGNVAVDAWVIRPNGEVSIFVPGQEDPRIPRNAYIRGFISPNGTFSRGNAPTGMPGVNAMQMNNNPYYFSYLNTSEVFLENERLEVWGPKESRFYVRMDMAIAAKIHRSSITCFRRQQAYPTDPNAQGNPGQYGIVPQPVPRAEEFVEEQTYRKGGRRSVIPAGPPMPGPMPGPGGGVGAMPDVATGEGMPVQ